MYSVNVAADRAGAPAPSAWATTMRPAERKLQLLGGEWGRDPEAVTAIAFARSRHGDVDGQYERTATRGGGALYEGSNEPTIPPYVHLEPNGPARRRSNL